MGSIQPVRFTMVEPVGVPEIYYTGIGAAHLNASGIVEMLLYRDTPTVEYQGIEHRVVARVFRPADLGAIERDARKVMDAIKGIRPPPKILKLPAAR